MVDGLKHPRHCGLREVSVSLIVQYSSMPLVVTAVMKQGEETVAMANTLEIASAPFRMLFLNFLQRQKQHIGNVITCCVITLIAPFFPPRHPPPPHPHPSARALFSASAASFVRPVPVCSSEGSTLSHPRSFHLGRHDSGASVPAFPGSAVSQGPMGSEWEGD